MWFILLVSWYAYEVLRASRKPTNCFVRSGSYCSNNAYVFLIQLKKYACKYSTETHVEDTTSTRAYCFSRTRVHELSMEESILYREYSFPFCVCLHVWEAGKSMRGECAVVKQYKGQARMRVVHNLRNRTKRTWTSGNPKTILRSTYPLVSCELCITWTKLSSSIGTIWIRQTGESCCSKIKTDGNANNKDARKWKSEQNVFHGGWEWNKKKFWASVKDFPVWICVFWELIWWHYLGTPPNQNFCACPLSRVIARAHAERTCLKHSKDFCKISLKIIIQITSLLR